MPQASLLDFFKSHIPGPFAPLGSSIPITPIEPQRKSEQSGSHSQQNTVTERLAAKGVKVSEEAGAAVAVVSSQPASIVRNATTLETPIFKDCLDLPGLVISNVETTQLDALRRLTGNLLPVRYPDAFFTGAVEDPVSAAFSRVATYDGKPVGWIRCRLDPFPESTVPLSSSKPIHGQVYIQALCLLAPYRGLGIATALLEDIIQPHLLREQEIAAIYAHVWESNEEALVWYERRGFQKVMKVDEYYRKLRPNGAWLFKRELITG